MRSLPLSQVGRIVTGKTPKTSNDGFFGGDTPFVTPSDMDGRRKISGTGRTLSNAGVASVKNCVIPPGAVMVSCIGSDMGKTHIASSRAVTNQQINSVIVDDRLFDPLFVYYNLFGRRSQLREMAAGAAQPILNKTEFGKVIIDFPSLEEQRDIAAILDALDDKIELNRRMAATLEEMARALYRSWFVDFDPVWAKAEGRTPAHMDESATALFPNSFGDDVLPVGWTSIRAHEAVNLIKGRSYKSSELQPSQTALVSLKSFQRKGGYRPDGLKAYTGDYKPAQVVLPGELVISLTDVTQAAELIARATYVRNSPNFKILVASLDVGIIRPIDGKRTPPEFLYQTFNSDSFLNHALAHTSGTTVLHLAKEAVPNYEMLLPSPSVVTAFERLAAPIRANVFRLESENQTLADLRNTLLPKLMSGELRVGEAQELIEAVA